jgi:hypothetical protein
MATTPRQNTPNGSQTPSASADGRVTNGGKGVAYLRDYYLPAMLEDQLQTVGSPGS